MKVTNTDQRVRNSGNAFSRRTWLVQMGGGLLFGARSVAQSASPVTKQSLARGSGQASRASAEVQQGKVVYPEGTFRSTVFDHRSQWVTDLGVAQPGTAISKESRKGQWRLVNYEAKVGPNSKKGSMLMCGPETQAPPVSIPLKAKGWHAVYVGLKTYLGIGEPNTIKLKLKSDPCYVLASVETVRGGVVGEDIGLSGAGEVERARLRRRQIQDCFYKFADLTNEELQVSALTTGLAQQGAIAYVRLVPLSASEIESLKQARQKKANRRLACLNDTLTFMHFRQPTTKEEIWEEIYPYKDTDYKAIYWTAARGDNCLYPTKVGTILGADSEDFPRIGDRYLAESNRILISKGIDSVQTALEFTRGLGMEFHLCMRVESFTAEPPWDGVFRSKFFYDHPELWCIDHDGRTIARLSYAFPESQQHLLKLIRELAQYRPDGIMLIFPRAQPYVLYERPVAEAFKKHHGLEPRQVDERDPRLLKVRADFLTDFMRKARREIEMVQGATKSIQFSTMVLANEDTNRFHAIDAETWAKEGIIDRLSPSPFSTIRSQADVDIEYFGRLTRGTRCRLSPTLRPSWLKVSQVMPLSRSFYDAGAEELIIFDVNLHHQYPTEWRLWQLLGRKEELAQLERQVDLSLTASEITKLNDIVVDKYSPLWAF
ncbi:MAG: family 10 glycosylhydrolase [Acidobacteria bacterium]|nr:family 10 glycosylhydrolase [Acidobacteriota bacterium]MCI0724512.1 family 10 glycosylhydrolase [Acidobacteriota bacterium]